MTCSQSPRASDNDTCCIFSSGGYPRSSTIHGAVKIEDVVVWSQVIDKYLSLQGLADDFEIHPKGNFDDSAISDKLQEVNEAAWVQFSKRPDDLTVAQW